MVKQTLGMSARRLWGHQKDLTSSKAPFDEDEGHFLGRRPAVSEAEIIAFGLELSDAHPAVVLQLAEKLGLGRMRDYEIAMAVLGYPLNLRYTGEGYWLLSKKEGEWVIRSDDDAGTRDRSDVGPAMFLPVYAMVGRVWGIPSPTELRALDQAKRLEMVLADADIHCKVTPTDDGEGVHFDTPDVDMAEISRLFARYTTPDWRLEESGEEPLPNKYEDVYWTPSPEETNT